MGWFRKKKEKDDRLEFREEFEKVIAGLKKADKITRMEVGHSINMANSALFQNFGDLGGFKKLSKNEQMSYLTKMHDMETKMQQEMPVSALGLGLYKMWLTTIMERDDDLSESFASALSGLSKEGEALGGGQ